jgi:hypothetical protein
LVLRGGTRVPVLAEALVIIVEGVSAPRLRLRVDCGVNNASSMSADDKGDDGGLSSFVFKDDLVDLATLRNGSLDLYVAVEAVEAS